MVSVSPVMDDIIETNGGCPVVKTGEPWSNYRLKTEIPGV
jgi:hypothetical protein